LIVISNIAGFIYFNMYFTSDLYNVAVAKKPGATGMVPDNCTYYNCRHSANYYIFNYAAYNMCNQGSCGSILCSNFNCNKPKL
jgi:hypothetical protein